MHASFAIAAGLVAVAVATKPTYVKTETVDVTVTSCAASKTDCVYSPTQTYWGDAEVPVVTEDPKTWVDAEVPAVSTSAVKTWADVPAGSDPSKTWVDAEVPAVSTPAVNTWADVPVASDPAKTWVDAEVPAVSTPAANTWADAPAGGAAQTWVDATTLVPSYPTGDKPVAGGNAQPTVATYKPSDDKVDSYTGAASSTVASFALAGFAAVAAMIIV